MEYNKYGFSLIELSIVLIIIGLLVAGTTGGASLIESAKIRGLINEMNSYRQAVYSFMAEKDRLPGDFGNYGNFGYYTDNTYSATTFGSPYDGNTYALPNVFTAPFIDLYLTEITDFKPVNTVDCSYGNCASLGGLPYSKIYNNFTIYYEYGTSDNPTFDVKARNMFVDFRADAWKFDYIRIFQKIDKKIDNGERGNGNFISLCYNNESYESLLLSKAKWCIGFYYSLGLK